MAKVDNVYWFAEDGTVQHMAVAGMYLSTTAYKDAENEVISMPVYTKLVGQHSWYVIEKDEGRDFELTYDMFIPESIHLYRLLAGDG